MLRRLFTELEPHAGEQRLGTRNSALLEAAVVRLLKEQDTDSNYKDGKVISLVL
jgi:hypothetical protein